MAKGGAFENTVIRLYAKAFACLGISENDIYRTKNSGATKDQQGDIQFSAKMAKMWPVLTECKHYTTVKYKLGRSVSSQPKSFHLHFWWKQVIREQKECKGKIGILVFRQNSCPIVVALTVKHYQVLIGKLPVWEQFSWSMFTSWKKEAIVLIPFDEFLVLAVDKIKQSRIISKRNKS